MSHTTIGALAFAALIAAGSAFAADAPPAASSAPTAASTATAPTAPAAPAMPPAVSSTPAATPTTAPSVAPEPAAAPAPVAETPAPAPMAAMPAKIEKPRVSACTRAIRSAEHDLKMSKAKPEAIAGAWQHIQAAKQARAMHKKDACKSEAAAASKMSSMM